MPNTLIKNISHLATMAANHTTAIRDGALWIVDHVIQEIGDTAQLVEREREADRVIDGRGLLIMPGLVNTHHHLYQTLTRALPEAQDAKLFPWLKTLYPIWAELTAEAIQVSTKIGVAELLLSGCTTTTDHLYIYPNDVSLDVEIKAARQMGIRFQPCRGSMSLGTSKGGLPPDRAVEDEDDILADTERLIRAYHDPNPYAMCRIVVAPCSPFSVTEELMRQSVTLARRHGCLLHTHLAETLDENQYCLDHFGARPLAYAAQLDWVGPDVWYAHGVHFNDDELRRLADTDTGVAHCPGSNMRLGSGIARIVEMQRLGIRVGLAVDGSASNDASHMLAETRLALLLQRVTKGADAMTVSQALHLATRGGAAVLGRDDIGSLEPGKAADLIGIRVERLEYAGAWRDPLAASLLCHPVNVDLSIINGRIIVQDGELIGHDLPAMIAEQQRISRQIQERAGIQ